ncbi:class I SAM-dependent methyltransferase [Streptomyces angustmyceticus]|uniref:class I SAM-dependent methyltransferase n=1 Tax=Streptomyces angustmyceticus TaxID=285578 RepID=UPI0021B0141B|nr:class I SAM-dependent methyltransferase [Streptomyces angustmyceticus]
MSDRERLRFCQSIHPGPGMMAADIGCGTGQWTRQLARWGVQVTGYDFSLRALVQARTARPLPGLSYVQWDVNGARIPLQLQPRSLDLVTCRLSLAYLEVDRFLANVGRWLTSRGTFWALTPVEYPNRPHDRLHHGLTEEAIRDLTTGWAYARTYRFGRRHRAIVLRGFGG